jgi:hypothetical protein
MLGAEERRRPSVKERHMGFLKRGIKDPVQGSMHIVGCTALDPHEMRAPCHVTFVVSAEGVEPFSGEHVFELWSNQWPNPGDDVPVRFDRQNHDHIEIRTDQIPTHAESARLHADQLAAQMRDAAQAPGGIAPIVIGNADPQRVEDALAKASQVLGVDLTGLAASAVHVDAPAPAAVAGSDDMVSRLERLAKLRDSGALTQDEFDTQKQRILAE